MDYMRKMHNAHERIKQLEIENTKLVTERDTLRQGCVCCTYSHGDSMLFIGTSSIDMGMSTL